MSVQLADGGPVFTTSGPATTSELRNVYPSANHSNTEGPLYMEFENTGDDVVLLEAGTDEFLKIEDGGSVEGVTNGTFDTDLTDWGQAAVDATNKVTWVAGRAYLETTSRATELYQLSVLTIGNTYELTCNIEKIAGNLRFNSVSPYVNLSEGLNNFTFVASDTKVAFLRGSTITQVYIDNVSIKEVDGKYLKLTDGVSQLQAACAAGEHKVGIAFAESRGDEEATDPTFSNESDTWITVVGGGAASIANNTLTLTGSTSSTVAVRNGTQITGLTVGQTYELKINARQSVYAGTAYRLCRVVLFDAAFGNLQNIVDREQLYSDFTTYSGEFYAHTANNNLYLYYDSAVGGHINDEVEFQELSVKEVTNKMNLNLDGTYADLTDSTAYDGTLGSGVLTFGETMRKVKRLNATDFDKQKTLIDKEMA